MSFNKMISIRRKEKDIYNLRNAKIKVTQLEKESAFQVQFIGPKETPYEKGKWKINLELPSEYPYKSPSVGFINKIYHPNIDYASGSVCLDVINQTWTPMYQLVNIFEIFLPQLLTYPNPQSPLNHQAGELYKHNKTQFNRKVIECIEKFALNEQYVVAVPSVEPKMDEEQGEENSGSSDENDQSFEESNSCSLSQRDSIADHEDLKLY